MKELKRIELQKNIEEKRAEQLKKREDLIKANEAKRLQRIKDIEAAKKAKEEFLQSGVSSRSYLQSSAANKQIEKSKDLEDYINESSNESLILTYENLQCGSRNHLRSFVTAIENLGFTYTPQFLTLEEYEAILNSSREQCN